MTTRTGLDVLAAEGCAALIGPAIGLITNHTAITSDRRHIVDVLHEAGANLRALFGPEHGIRGELDEVLKVTSTTDPATGLPVHSLYSSVQRPTLEMLEGIEMLVFDIADVGVRFYTYTTTMVYCMEEAARVGTKFVVLDRPNPITASRVEGPVLDPAFRKLSAYHPVPTRHGLTAGELALFANTEYGIGCELDVIPCEGWRREMWFDETGLPWVNPSPNLRNLTQATLYPAIGGFEASEVSVGRGTDSPFELFGAPYMDGREVATRLNALAEQRCSGCFVFTTDRERLRPVEANVRIACELTALYPEEFDMRRSEWLVGGLPVAEAIQSGTPADEIIVGWQPAVEDYMQRRERCLLY